MSARSTQAAEITARGVSKGSALQFLADRLGISREAIVAFGNDDNDLSLRDHAGRFVAARASTPAALDAADEVADSTPQAALRLCLSGETEIHELIAVRITGDRLAVYGVWAGCRKALFPIVLLLLSTCALVGESYNPFLYFQF